MNVSSVNVNLGFVGVGLEAETCLVESILKLLNAVMMMTLSLLPLFLFLWWMFKQTAPNGAIMLCNVHDE